MNALNATKLVINVSGKNNTIAFRVVQDFYFKIPIQHFAYLNALVDFNRMALDV